MCYSRAFLRKKTLSCDKSYKRKKTFSCLFVEQSHHQIYISTLRYTEKKTEFNLKVFENNVMLNT